MSFHVYPLLMVNTSQFGSCFKDITAYFSEPTPNQHTLYQLLFQVGIRTLSLRRFVCLKALEWCNVGKIGVKRMMKN